MHKFRVPFHMQPDGYGLLVLCVLIGVMLDGGWRGPFVGLLLVISLLLHEIGHMCMAASLGVQVKEFGISLFGAYTRRSYATNRHDEILIALAGPLTSFCIAMPLIGLHGMAHQVALGNMALGFINLIPIPSSDGMHILKTLRSPNAPGPDAAGSIVTALSESRSN
jgi:Zn-dependent protease